MAEQAAANYFLSEEAKDYGPLQFRTVQEVHEWLNAEVEFWSWCTKPNPHVLGFNDDKRNQFWLWVSNARDHCTTYLQTNDVGALNSLNSALRQYAQSGLVSGTARSQFIVGLKNPDFGQTVAASALGIYLGSGLDPDQGRQPQEARYPSFLGRIAIALFDLGCGPQTSDGVKNSVQAISSDFSRYLQSQTAANDEALAALRAALEQASTEHTDAQLNHAEEIAKLVKELTSSTNTALKSIDDKKAAFTEFMKLKAPVQYWTKKSAKHVRAARFWLWGLTTFTALGSAALICVFIAVYKQALMLATASSDRASPVLIVLTAGAGVATTIIFWIARFLSRLYLSERHMGIDAGLRSTLAETYLAMTEEGKVSDSDRALVLPALFRPGADGIVQDDTSIDGLLALVARHLEKPK